MIYYLIKHKLIMDANYDDVALQPGDDSEFKNQFREFLQNNLKMDDTQPKKVEKKCTKKVKDILRRLECTFHFHTKKVKAFLR